MGTPTLPLPVKLVIAITYDQESDIGRIVTTLDQKFGPQEYSYGPVPFSWSNYYEQEMGSNLYKLYFNYKNLIERQDLVDIKLFTNGLEQTCLKDGNRTINIDPGYLASDKFVLATTKDFYHRLYLGKGIYGEETLHYRRGRFRYFSWTYPDYRMPGMHEFLEKARATLVKEIRVMEDAE